MFISGIQQVGIGVGDVKKAFDWYRKTLGFDLPVFEEAAEAALMLPYTGGEPRSRHAILALNMQGGGGLEIWQYTSRTPEASKFDIQLGDLGICINKIKCKDVAAFHKEMEETGEELYSSVLQTPEGKPHFYMADPWGNLIEIVESGTWFTNLGFLTGGVSGVCIGVSDLDRAKAVYTELLGYDVVVYDQSDTFEDFKALKGGNTSFRRVLLRHSENRKGPFSPLLGATEIELVQRLDSIKPRKIFENRMWGDLGYIHLCFDITGMKELQSKCEKAGFPFTVDSSNSFDMGEAAGHFSYIEDPDATLIEFVETHKVPILKKIGWYLNLQKRKKPEKPLPSFILKAMGLSRVKI